jgi:PIN domain nuclease of toxin-antitoxin system
MNFVADTHALLWWFTDSPKISPKAAEVFEKCEAGENIIFIPSIVIAEALSIFDKKRISFNFKNLFKKVNDSENFVLIALDYPILEKMVALFLSSCLSWRRSTLVRPQFVPSPLSEL